MNITMRLSVLSLVLCVALAANAQNDEEKEVKYMPEFHGTVRAKYEYQTEDGESRFLVRNARMSLSGNVAPIVEYKAEIDFSDEGNIKMLDAYTRLKPFKNFNFTIGQMRVPFTIDAHRSPHAQYFANRSFIAKQVGNVRDVGATVGYTFQGAMPLTVEAGLFNGSGLTNNKNFWTKSMNFSAKAQLKLPQGFNLQASVQKVRPDVTSIMMYDGGLYYHAHGWHVEAEYLFKHYSHDAWDNVHAVDAFISYDIAIRNKKCLIKKVTPLFRYDFMSDHWDGEEYDDDGNITLSDSKRSRYTVGLTFSLAKPFISDIRLNFEKYCYSDNAVIATSEKDKIVLEFMTRF